VHALEEYEPVLEVEHEAPNVNEHRAGTRHNDAKNRPAFDGLTLDEIDDLAGVDGPAE
jgi:hypothetical protein